MQVHSKARLLGDGDADRPGEAEVVEGTRWGILRRQHEIAIQFDAGDVVVHPAEVAQLTRLLGSRTGDGPSIVSVRGQAASGALLTVRVACAAAQRSVLVADREHKDVVWSYPDPIPECPGVRGLMCFFNEKVDLTIDGELQPRPLSPWS